MTTTNGTINQAVKNQFLLSKLKWSMNDVLLTWPRRKAQAGCTHLYLSMDLFQTETIKIV